MKPSHPYDAFAAKRAHEFASNKNLVHTYIEKPAMYALLPDLRSKSVLCVGCGTGEECAELKSRGAGEVVGIDISSTSIEYAAQHVVDVLFWQIDMDNLSELLALGEGQFDLIYSSLTLHYSNDLKALLDTLHKLLKPNGELLFSVGHPLRWATDVRQKGDTKSVIVGYSQGKDGIEIFGDYLSTKQFTQKLSGGPEVTYWMRPISAYFDLLRNSGYELTDFKEPVPIKDARAVDEDFWKLRTKMPVDMVFLAQART
jgi:SAM-dependent methyltransferase